MDNITFKPKYEIKLIVSFLIMVPAGWFVLIIMLIKGMDKVELFLSGLLFASSVFFIPFLFYKKITFQEYIKIDRFFNSPKIINYRDIKDIGLDTIITSKGNISIRSMKNRNELLEIFSNLQQNDKIYKEQLAGTLAVKEIISYKAAVISSLLSIIILFFLNYFSIRISNFGGRIEFLLVWLISFAIIYFFLKLKVKNTANKIL